MLAYPAGNEDIDDTFARVHLLHPPTRPAGHGIGTGQYQQALRSPSMDAPPTGTVLLSSPAARGNGSLHDHAIRTTANEIDLYCDNSRKPPPLSPMRKKSGHPRRRFRFSPRWGFTCKKRRIWLCLADLSRVHTPGGAQRRSFGLSLITLVPRRLHGEKRAGAFRPTTRSRLRLGLVVRCGDLADDDGELIVRASSAVLKSQGLENWSRGRPGCNVL